MILNEDWLLRLLILSLEEQRELTVKDILVLAIFKGTADDMRV